VGQHAGILGQHDKNLQHPFIPELPIRQHALLDKTLILTQMNDALTNLYASKWDNLISALKPIEEDPSLVIKPANPLLLYIDEEEEYRNADIRLVVFGQETNSWYEKEKRTIGYLQTRYDSFFNEGECWTYGGQFWAGIRRFLSSLQKKFPAKKIRLTWNNIVKISRHADKGIPPGYIYEIERRHFHVIPAELEILNPDIVLFLTGPNYDRIIKDNFGELKYEALPNATERQISRVILPNVRYAYRTYHPNYLWRNDIDDYFDTIIEDINF
jgi:hypothetical protein